MRSVSDPEADDTGRAPPYTRLQRPSAASARRSRRIASSEIWNSSANSEAITESPASSLSAITSLLDVGSDESCINKKYHELMCISSACFCTIGKKFTETRAPTFRRVGGVNCGQPWHRQGCPLTHVLIK